MQPIYEIKSADGRVMKVYEDRVVLTQAGLLGFMSRGLSGDKTIYFSDITSVQFKEAGWTAGFMEFTFPGSNDRRGGPISGASNENRFTFGKPTIGAARKLNEEVLVAKAFIEKRIHESKKQNRVLPTTFSKVEELSNLQKLLDSEAINQEEYEKLKKEVLEK